MSADPRIDDMFFAILNNVGGIDKFLDTVFSFLYRRTDFFKIKKSNEERLGLPPGVAQRMIKMISLQYIDLEKKKTGSVSHPEKEDKGEAVKAPEEDQAKKKQKTKSDSASQNAVPSSEDSDTSVYGSSHRVEENQENPVNNAKEQTDTTEEASGEEQVAAKNEASDDSERRYYDANPECYNGASYENYSWAQNNNELDVQVKVPNGVKTGQQVKVVVKKKQLKVEALEEEKWVLLLDGTFLYDVKDKESTWTLHPNDHVHINVEKDYPRYWEALLEGEPKLNVRNIDCSIPYEDVEEEARAKLQQMMFDQHQKRLGKPTSEEMKVQELLKQAWNKKDSPFKGQEFDPSVIKLAH